MAIVRSLHNSIVRTYLKVKNSPTGTMVHVRVCAPAYHLDRKGSGSDIENALANAVAGIQKATPKPAKK